MSILSSYSPCLPESYDPTADYEPTRDEWAAVMAEVCDDETYLDECPAVPESVFYDPTEDDVAWWTLQDQEGGWCEARGTPYDLELRTVSALEHHLASFPEID
jgi:hypothetical protein